MTRHAFDALSFTFGVILLIAGVMLLSGRPSTEPLEWVGPVAAVGLGVVILVANLPRRRPEPDAAAEPDVAAEPDAEAEPDVAAEPDEPMGDAPEA
jgi:hypothetical protein